LFDYMELTQISEFPNQPKVIFGVGSAGRVSDEIKRYKPKRVLVVTDKDIETTAAFQETVKALSGASIKHVIFNRVLPEPPVESIEDVVRVIKEEKADLLLAIGGGSSIDTAKVGAIIATNGGKPQQYAGRNKFNIPPLPVIAIPTTAGTGAEMSSHSAITDAAVNWKFTIIHTEYNKPKVSILDPLFLETCPPKVVVDAGVDAFVHALESYVSLEAGPYCKASAIRAIKLISGAIKPFYANRKNRAAAAAMLVGSAMAGSAFASLSGAGNIHCIARFVGPKYHLTHGLSNAVLLPYVARFNALAVPERFARVAEAMGEDVAGITPEKGAEKAVQAIEKMCKDLGVPPDLKAYGGREEDIEDLAQKSYQTYLERYQPSNPRQTTLDDFRRLIGLVCK